MYLDTILLYVDRSRQHKARPKEDQSPQLLTIPGNVREMQLVLGIVNYLSRFSPKIAHLTGCLRPLLKKETYTKL